MGHFSIFMFTNSNFDMLEILSVRTLTKIMCLFETLKQLF